jgi:hypothetical protein
MMPLPLKTIKKKPFGGYQTTKNKSNYKEQSKKEFENNRHVFKQRCDSNRQKTNSLETLNSYTLKNSNIGI